MFKRIVRSANMPKVPAKMCRTDTRNSISHVKNQYGRFLGPGEIQGKFWG